MSNSASDVLALVKDLINEFKLEEALQHIKDIEQKKNLTNEEMLRNQAFKVRIHYYLGKYKIALNLIEELYQKSQEMKFPLFSLDALYIKGWILRFQVKFEERNEIFKQHEESFNSIPRDKSLEFQEKEACFWIMKAHQGEHFGSLDLPLEYSGRSLSWFERVDPLSPYVITNLVMMASIYQEKGELNLALEYNEKALSLIPEGEYYHQMLIKGHIYQIMGHIYYEKGVLDSALEYYFKFRDIVKEMKFTDWTPFPYYHIIKVLLAHKNVTQAKQYLEELKLFVEKHQPKDYHYYYRERLL